MGIIYALLPLSLALALIALGAYLWALRAGQFDDLETPALRVLFDDVDADESERKNPTGGSHETHPNAEGPTHAPSEGLRGEVSQSRGRKMQVTWQTQARERLIPPK